MTTPRPTNAVRRDRAAGVVVASAAADALGAPHEFGPQLPPDQVLAMTGGGQLGWAPGEWTDDTQQALAVLTPLSRPVDGDVTGAVERRLIQWYTAGPRDIGTQTRAVFERARRDGTDLTRAGAAYQLEHPDNAGNGSLMRTGPVALAGSGDVDAVARLATAISAFTHPHVDAVDACVLWSTAIARAIEGPTGAPPDWVELVSRGLVHLPADRHGLWRDRLARCRTAPPESFAGNGWVVTALQAALAAIAQTHVPAGASACAHLRLAVERAIRIGDDTDTVAAIAGALLGAHWGATAVPHQWRRTLHGELTHDAPPLALADLDHLARRAIAGGRPDDTGWPGTPSLLPHYREVWPAAPLAEELTDGVVIGNVHAVPDMVDRVDAVISLCRMGDADLPDTVEHHVVGLLDTSAADNPNLGFVLTDTCDLVAALTGGGKRVFLHCVQARNRTPAVAAAHLVRHHGVAPDAALDRVERLVGTRPRDFLVEAVRAVPRPSSGGQP